MKSETFSAHHRDIVPVEQYLIQFCDSSSLRRRLKLWHVLEDHVHEVVETEKRPNDLLVVFHDDMHARADCFVDELWKGKIG